MSSAWTDVVLMEGPGARVVVEIDGEGNGPVVRFLADLGQKNRNDFNKTQALLQKAAEVGPENIRNQEKNKSLGDGLYAFKPTSQVRIFWMYGEGAGNQRTVVLLDGVVKKRNRHKPQDLKRARALAARREQEGKS